MELLHEHLMMFCVQGGIKHLALWKLVLSVRFLPNTVGVRGDKGLKDSGNLAFDGGSPLNPLYKSLNVSLDFCLLILFEQLPNE